MSLPGFSFQQVFSFVVRIEKIIKMNLKTEEATFTLQRSAKAGQ